MFEWFDEHIFNDIGRQIQKWAIISLIIDVITCFIVAIRLHNGFLFSLLVVLCGFGYALFFAFPIYAFGQLVEDIHKTQKDICNMNWDIHKTHEEIHSTVKNIHKILENTSSMAAVVDEIPEL